MDLAAYFTTLPRDTCQWLLGETHCVLAIFQNFHELDRLMVLRMLQKPFLPIDQIVNEKLNSNDSIGHLDDIENKIMPSLFKLNVLKRDANQLTMDQSFRSTLFRAFQSTSIENIVKSRCKETIDDIHVNQPMIQKSSLPYPTCTNLEKDKIKEFPMDSKMMEDFCQYSWEMMIFPLLNLACPHSNLQPSLPPTINIQRMDERKKNRIKMKKSNPSRTIRQSKKKPRNILRHRIDSSSHQNDDNHDEMAFRKSILWPIYEQCHLVDSNSIILTNRGYQFILSDMVSQLWTLISQWISTIDHQWQGETISFLIYLAIIVGPNGQHAIPIHSLSQPQSKCLKLWYLLGLIILVDGQKGQLAPIYYEKDKMDFYLIVTPWLGQLFQNQLISSLNVDQQVHHWKKPWTMSWSRGLMVESNFYLYAYTTSQVIITILALFCQLVLRLPNLCIARITRKSIQKALNQGISAKHIIQYLQMNRHSIYNQYDERMVVEKEGIAREKSMPNWLHFGSGYLHPLDGKSSSSDIMKEILLSRGHSSRQYLCQQVEEQLILWEEEQTRFHWYHSTCWVFEPYDDPNWYVEIKKYAIQRDALLWSNDDQLCLYICQEAEPNLIQWYRKLQRESESPDHFTKQSINPS